MKKSVRIVLSVLITVLLLIAMLRLWGSGDIILAFSSAKPVYILVAVFVYVLTYPVRSFRIYYMARKNPDVSYKKVLPVCMQHQFYSRIFPFKAGELSLVYLLKTNCRLNVSKGSTVLLFIRFFDIIAIVTSYLICNIFVMSDGVVSKLALFGLLGVCVCAVIIMKMFPCITSFLRKHKKEKIAGNLDDVYGMLREQKAADLAVMIFLTAFLWMLVYLSMHFTVMAFCDSISVSETVVASFLASVAAFLPINGIGGFGTTEAGWTLGFTLIGMDKNTALISGLVSNLMSFVIICVFGLISFLKRGSKDV